MCFIIISASSKKLLLILYGHPSIKKVRLLFAANLQVNNYSGPFEKGAGQHVDFFSDRVAL